MKQLLIAALLLTGTAGFAQKPANRPAVHRLVADWSLKTPDGGTLQLSSFRGHIVVVDFWASWCIPCRASIPHLKEVYAAYHADGLEMVSVSIDARPEAWARAMAQEQMPWGQVLDHYTGENNLSDVAGGYGIESIPYLLVIDKDGKALVVNPEPKALDKQLKKLFGH